MPQPCRANRKAPGVTTPRMRRTAVTAVFLSLGLALTACGSRVDPAGTGGSAPAAASCVDTSGSIDQGRLPELAVRHDGDQRGHGPRLAEAGHRRDQRRRRRARQAARAVVARTARPTGRPFAEKAEKLITQRQGRRGVRRLDLGAAARRCCRSSRATRRCCSTRSSTRAWSRRRTSSTPARPPTSRSCPALDYLKEKGVKSALPGRLATTSSRTPPTRSSRRTRRRTAWRSWARSTRRWATPTSPPSSTRSRAPTPTRCSTRSTATATSRSSRSTRTPA